MYSNVLLETKPSLSITKHYLCLLLLWCIRQTPTLSLTPPNNPMRKVLLFSLFYRKDSSWKRQVLIQDHTGRFRLDSKPALLDSKAQALPTLPHCLGHS